YLFIAALKLNPFVPDKAELASMLDAATSNCGREVPAREIEAAIRNSQRCCENPGPAANPRWSPRDDESIRAVLRDGPGLAQLEAISPVRFADDKPHTEEVIDALFPGNPLLCAAKDKERPFTWPRAGLRGRLRHQQFIVPSPMCKFFGWNQDGRQTMR